MTLTSSAATKKKPNVTAADRSAMFTALPRNDQFRVYSPYEMTKAQAAASSPKTAPSAALSSRVTTVKFARFDEFCAVSEL